MKLLDEKAVSEIYGIPLSTLRSWRFRKVGPVYYKIGSSCRYRETDIEGYLEQCRRTPASAPENG